MKNIRETLRSMAQWWGACLVPQKVESIRELRIPNYISIQSLYNLQNSQESQVVQQMVATLFKVTFYYHAVTQLETTQLAQGTRPFF